MALSYLIVGAGPIGLGMARVLRERGIPYEQVEADVEVGGNWYHGVYRTAHVISCKQVMEYPEYPMPDSYPDFPSQPQLSRYFIDYAHRYALRRDIRFGTKAIHARPVAGNRWRVWFSDGTEATYAGVLVCNGHHWSKRFPRYEGTFTGEYIHSKDYKDPDQLRSRRVLVIGAGNSGCDIVCEAGRVGRSARLSMRRSVWIFPKSFMGRPLGHIRLPPLPGFVEDALTRALLRLTFGTHSRYGLPEPAYRFFERHPTVSEELPDSLRHGRVSVRPDVARFDGRVVEFTDGSREEFDLVVAATGYNLDFPFLPAPLVRVSGSHLRVYGYCAYEDYQGLYFIGWPQVRGGVGSLISAFAQVVADFIEMEQRFGIPIGRVLKSRGEKPADTHLMGSREMFRWIDRTTMTSLARHAAAAARDGGHANRPIENGVVSDRAMVVF